MGCQKAIAEKIRSKEGHYVLALKENQSHLLESAKLFMEQGIDTRFSHLVAKSVTDINKDHGRIETRTYIIAALPDGIAWEDEKKAWSGLKSIGRVTSKRQIGDKITCETRYFITSLHTSENLSARRFAKAMRGHWGIENSLHWVLDMSFNEDASRARRANTQENMCILRKIALTLIKQDETKKASIRSKRNIAAWDIEFMATLIGF